MKIESLQRRIREAETALILLTIAALARGDYVVGLSASLGPLYLIPLSYSALTHRLRTTLALTVLCVALRQWLGPIGTSGPPFLTFVRDLGVAGLFLVPVVYLHRLGKRRREFFELARRQRDDLAREVSMAAALQQRMLDLGQPPEDSLDAVARTVPLKGVGGDYYDFIVAESGRVFVVAADVAGKGLPAAMLMPAVQIGLRAAAAHQSDLVSTVAELNRILYLTTAPESYATLFIAGIDVGSGELEYVNAGHLPGLLVGPDGSTLWLDRGGVPVGLLEGSRYESGRATLEPRGLLVLYTDGVTEAENAAGDDFGQARLRDLVVANSGLTAEALVSAIQSSVNGFIGAAERSDDTTVIVIRRPGSEGNGPGAQPALVAHTV